MRKRYVRALVGVAALSLVAAACGSSSSKGSSNNSSNNSSGSTNTTGAPATSTGGTLTIGAEQEPSCVDWVSACMDSTWGFWVMENATMPSAYRLEPQADGSYKNVPTVLLTGDATLETKPVQKITYNLNPKAVWSDGVPINCDDFNYTWKQIIGGNKILDPTGYTDIANVDCSNEEQPVVTYKPNTSFATWQQLFGGAYGIMPSHILKSGDRDAEMKNGYSWSGGPWLMKWTKHDNVTMTPNKKYWGPQPKLDKVIFKFITDTAAEFQAFKSNQVQAIYPQPTPDVVAALSGGGMPSGAHQVTNAHTGAVEALWYNSSHAPFTDKVVRQAVGYAVDRDAIVKQLFGPIGVKKAVNSLNPPLLSLYSDQNAFSAYHLDLSKVNSLMTGDGWTKQGGIWTKNGKKASFGIYTNQGNKRRQLTVNVLLQEFKTAGFDVHPVYRTADQLFGQDLAAGNYDMGLFANQLTSYSPGLCSSFCTKNIPTAKNGNTGNNVFRFSDPAIDKQLLIVDTSLDASAGEAAAKQADDLMAQNPPAIPIDPLPNVLLWSKRVQGPITDNPVNGMFWNLNEWGCENGACT